MVQDAFTDIGLTNEDEMLIINRSSEYYFKDLLRDAENLGK